MPTLAEHLALTNQQVLQAEARCARQAALITQMREQGYDTTEAERLHKQFEEALRVTRQIQQQLRAAQGV